jgi:hypothetical protein
MRHFERLESDVCAIDHGKNPESRASRGPADELAVLASAFLAISSHSGKPSV